jgi:hypothetical protein
VFSTGIVSSGVMSSPNVSSHRTLRNSMKFVVEAAINIHCKNQPGLLNPNSTDFIQKSLSSVGGYRMYE